jgi:hypothetical protein
MVADRDNHRRWRLLWLGSIQAFADSYTQKAQWLATTEIRHHASFSDCMSGYFDGANLCEPNAYERRLTEGQINPAEVAAVSKFHSLAECYESPSGDDWNSDAILRDPKWQEVVAAAAEAQERLLHLLTDETEKMALTTPLFGREQADAESFGSTVPGAKCGSTGQDVGSSIPRLHVLTKPATAATSHIPEDVRRQLLPLGFTAENSKHGVTYRIGTFALSHNNTMFAAYSQVRLVREGGFWVLRLSLNKALWLVFLISPFVFLGKHPIGSSWVWDLAKGITLAIAIFSTSVFWSWTRVSRWWNRL